jgi:hypothetical protein
MNHSDDIVVAPHIGPSPREHFLSSQDWIDIPKNKIYRYWSGEVAPTEKHGEAEVCWSEVGLHVRFVCKQRESIVASAAPVVNRKTLQLWERDVCEIFLAPDSSHPECYFEFEAAPTGEWVDLGIHVAATGRETDWEYESGMTAEADVREDSIIVGMSIPWSTSIPKPRAGDEWRVNLFRCIGRDPVFRYLAWRPTYTEEPNFHVPDAFGLLRFK